MLEHIFRNIDDIRIFDLLSEFTNKDDAVDIDEIMRMLEYNEYKRCQVEDSVAHLVREHVLEINKVQVVGVTGCKMCRIAGRLKIPRLGDHKKHVPEKDVIGYVERYFLKHNQLTAALDSVVFAHADLTAEEIIKNDNNI